MYVYVFTVPWTEKWQVIKITLWRSFGLAAGHTTRPLMQCVPLQFEDEVKWSSGFFLFLTTKSYVHFCPLKPSLYKKRADHTSHKVNNHIGNTTEVSMYVAAWIMRRQELWMSQMKCLPSSLQPAPAVWQFAPPRCEGVEAAAAWSAMSSMQSCTVKHHECRSYGCDATIREDHLYRTGPCD